MSIALKRIYEPPSDRDGLRVLVERLWPRGVSKEAARVDLWTKEVAPSPELRRWFSHEPEKWTEFKARYFAELSERQAALAPLLAKTRSETVTFVFASKEERFNNAVALKEYVEGLS